MAQGWEIVEASRRSSDRFIPGHDPIVSEIYPRASDKVDASPCISRPRVLS